MNVRDPREADMDCYGRILPKFHYRDCSQVMIIENLDGSERRIYNR
jgi:hypothetical protein